MSEEYSDLVYSMVIDVAQRCPACALLNGKHYGELLWMFDPRSWVIFPNSDLYYVKGTIKQWQDFADEVNGRYK